tara:strand:+ start:570 stop:1178 length:609 start_codon:yes stop_codon:yes gene_type:complete
MENCKLTPPGLLKPLPYEISEEVEAIAKKVLNDLTIHANIAYIESDKKAKWLGKCEVVPAIYKLLTNYDYIIYVNVDEYRGLNPKQKEALIFHELEHIAWKPNIKDPEFGKWSSRRHDVGEFNSVIQRYGRWYGDVDNVSKSLDQFDKKYQEAGETLIDKETGEILYSYQEKIMDDEVKNHEQEIINEINTLNPNFNLKVSK